MVQAYLELLPGSATSMTVVLLYVAAAAGLVLWVAGAAFSRSLTTLLTVALGALIGMQLPRWCGWEISGAGPAVGGAVILGVTGFVAHSGWAGLLLGAMLTVWAAFATWLCTGGQPIIWPPVYEATTFASYLSDLWSVLPAETSKYLPYTTAGSIITGLAFAILWTRVTTLLAWSVTGTTLALGSALAAIDFSRPDLLTEARLPAIWAQGAIVFGMVLVGLALQWKIAGGPKRKSKSKPPADKPAKEGSN